MQAEQDICIRTRLNPEPINRTLLAQPEIILRAFQSAYSFNIGVIAYRLLVSATSSQDRSLPLRFLFHFFCGCCAQSNSINKNANMGIKD